MALGDSIRLTEAMTANENGLASLRSQRQRLEVQYDRLRNEILDLDREINARDQLQTAMKGLQAVYPDNETIRFVVPGVSRE